METRYVHRWIHGDVIPDKKQIPIGRGGIILTDNKTTADWLKKARNDGRDITKLHCDDNVDIAGWHFT